MLRIPHSEGARESLMGLYRRIQHNVVIYNKRNSARVDLTSFSYSQTLITHYNELHAQLWKQNPSIDEVKMNTNLMPLWFLLYRRCHLKQKWCALRISLVSPLNLLVDNCVMNLLLLIMMFPKPCNLSPQGPTTIFGVHWEAHNDLVRSSPQLFDRSLRHKHPFPPW